MTPLSKTNRSQRLNRFAIALLLAMVPMINSCAATRWGGGTGIVIEAETKQPMAGVHIVLYLSSSSPSAFPFGNSAQGCGPDFYAVSDAQGKFTIPEDALDQPRRFSFTRTENLFHAMAYKAGYTDAREVEGVSSTGEGDVKTGPLKVTFEMAKEGRTLFARKEWLSQLTMAGCRCGDLHTAMLQEIKEIEPLADREEAVRKRGGKPLGPGEFTLPRGSPYPRRTCP